MPYYFQFTFLIFKVKKNFHFEHSFFLIKSAYYTGSLYLRSAYLVDRLLYLKIQNISTYALQLEKNNINGITKKNKKIMTLEF